MSKSYGNTISMRENPDSLVIKLKNATDPARVKRDDRAILKNAQYGPCKMYSSKQALDWVKEGVPQLQLAARM